MFFAWNSFYVAIEAWLKWWEIEVGMWQVLGSISKKEKTTNFIFCFDHVGDYSSFDLLWVFTCIQQLN